MTEIGCVPQGLPQHYGETIFHDGANNNSKGALMGTLNDHETLSSEPQTLALVTRLNLCFERTMSDRD